MKFSFFMMAILALSPIAGADSPSTAPYSSPYSSQLDHLASEFNAELFKRYEVPGKLAIRCFSTPDHKYYIGAQQIMRIKAPLDRVAAVVADYSSYAQIFDGIIKSTAQETEQGTVVFLEQNIPIPLVPNVKTLLHYEVQKPSPTRQIFRYHLLKSNSLTEDDGFIWLEEATSTDGKKETLYAEFDFFDANWGLAATFAPGRIWSDSVKGLYQSDIAFALKSEHPDWKNEKVLSESKRATEDFSPDATIEAKKPLSETYPDTLPPKK